MRVLFMGTPDIAASCLSALAASHHELCGVVTSPDKPRGRKYVMTPPPVKVTAEALSLPVYQPERLRDGELLPVLDALTPDVIVVVAYGKILPKYVLDHPRYGCLNLHVSLLPKYRGAAPMQRAIMAGERETGVSVMYMDEGLDTGDILSLHRFPIGPQDDLGAIEHTSAEIGGRALIDALDALAAGNAPRTPQAADGATYAEKITKEECLIDFSRPSAEILARIRGLSPAPLALTHGADGKSIKILAARAGDGADPFGIYPALHTASAAPGTVIALSDKGEGGITVATGDGEIVIVRVTPEGKGAMNAADFIRGRRVSIGDLLL